MRKTFGLLLIMVTAFIGCKEPFKKTDHGLEYRIISEGKGNTVKYGDFIQIQVAEYYETGKKDSLMSDSRTVGPQLEWIDTSSTPITYYNIFKQMRKGDSLILRTLSD